MENRKKKSSKGGKVKFVLIKDKHLVGLINAEKINRKDTTASRTAQSLLIERLTELGIGRREAVPA